LASECPKKLYFTNDYTFYNKKANDSFLKSLLFGIVMLLFFSSCEDKSIHKEIERLQILEKELNKFIGLVISIKPIVKT
jgi:hypothetical protein